MNIMNNWVVIKDVRSWVILFLLSSVLVNAIEADGGVNVMEDVVPVNTVKADITTAPNVPPFITRTMPEIVEVHFETSEIVRPLADGKNYKFWSFNGTVPGPMVRVRLGDTVEFHLSNHSSSQFPHNIDIHAVNGPGGGASVSLVAPGEERIFRFKTLHPGLYVYHCASPIPSIPAHIANGMYGLLLVEPKHGFPRVDHEFYVVESEFYTQDSDEEDPEQKVEQEPEEPNMKEEKKETGLRENILEDSSGKAEPEEEKGLMDSFLSTFFGDSADSQISEIQDIQEVLSETLKDSVLDEPVDIPQPEKKYLLELSLEKGLKEQPDYVVFNGSKGALLGENALRVNVGEKVRIYFGNIGPNGISSFHIIGEVFDHVYLEGAVNGITNRNVQTTLVPSAGATIVEFTIDVPGDYLLVDHSIFRIDKGAIGLITAVGKNDPEIFESIK